MNETNAKPGKSIVEMDGKQYEKHVLDASTIVFRELPQTEPEEKRGPGRPKKVNGHAEQSSH